jgi:uncharacterized membrane protein YqjE
MPDDRLDPAEASPGIIKSLIATVRDARGLLADHIELAALDAERAAGSLVRVLIVTIVAAILVVGAWVAVVVGTALWATQAGMSLTAALFVAAAANIIFAVLLLVWLRRHVPQILFAATLRQLRKSTGADEREAGP